MASARQAEGPSESLVEAGRRVHRSACVFAGPESADPGGAQSIPGAPFASLGPSSLLLEPVALNGDLELQLPESEEQMLCTEEAMERLQVRGPGRKHLSSCPTFPLGHKRPGSSPAGRVPSLCLVSDIGGPPVSAL